MRSARAEAERPAADEGPTDEALVARVAAGDRAAYACLVDRHLDRTVAVARRILGSTAAAEDVAQEAFLRLWRGADRFRPQEARFTTWFHRITVNLCLDQHRRPVHGALELAGDPADPGADPAAALEKSRLDAALEAAVAALPERQRAAIALTYQAGLSNAEAAASLTLSVKALETLLVRARRTLRESLAAWSGRTSSGEKMDRGGGR